MIEISCVFEEGGVPVSGRVVIDRFVAGSSSGGVRMRKDVTSEELRRLAAAMTLKFGFLGIPQGGAKAGIGFDPGAPEEARKQALFRFGREIAPLVRNRTFIPGPDMGTSPEDIRVSLRRRGPEAIEDRDFGCRLGLLYGLFRLRRSGRGPHRARDASPRSDRRHRRFREGRILGRPPVLRAGRERRGRLDGGRRPVS